MFALTLLSVVMGLPVHSSLLSMDAKGEMLVTDVIKFYDPQCWVDNCEEALDACIKVDSTCEEKFTAGGSGGPMEGMINMKWKELSKGMIGVIQCAKNNACAPDENFVEKTVSLPGQAAPMGSMSMMEQQADSSMTNEEKGELMVDDLIRNYDLKCWQQACEEAAESCIMNDPECSQRFDIAHKQDNVTGGTPGEAFAGLKWKQLSAAMRGVIDCAKQNGCTPDAQQVAENELMPGMTGAHKDKAASFIEVASDGTQKIQRDTKQELAEHFHDFSKNFDHDKVDNLHKNMAAFLERGRKAYQAHHPELARPASNLRSD